MFFLTTTEGARHPAASTDTISLSAAQLFASGSINAIFTNGWIKQHVEVLDPPPHGHGECQRYTEYDRAVDVEETTGLGALVKTGLCAVVRTQEGCGEFPYLGVCRCGGKLWVRMSGWIGISMIVAGDEN